MRVNGQIFLPAYGAKDTKCPFNAPFLLSEIRNHPFTSGFDREIIAEGEEFVNSPNQRPHFAVSFDSFGVESVGSMCYNYPD